MKLTERQLHSTTKEDVLHVLSEAPRKRKAPRGTAISKEPKNVRTVADLSSAELRSAMEDILLSARTGITLGSSADVGDLVIDTLEKLGLDLSELGDDE